MDKTRNLKLICPDCGKEFVDVDVEVDAYVEVVGVEGFINGFDGFKIVNDPTKPHRCPHCSEKVIAQAYLLMP